jgi:hypothetical protein
MADIADRRLWFTADKTELVEDGDPRAAFLAAIPGRPIPDVDLTAEPETEVDEPAAPDLDGTVSGLTIQTEDQEPESDDNVCAECGFEAKNAAGLAAHQRKHVSAGGAQRGR